MKRDETLVANLEKLKALDFAKAVEKHDIQAPTNVQSAQISYAMTDSALNQSSKIEQARIAAPSNMLTQKLSDTSAGVTMAVQAKKISHPEVTLAEGELIPAVLETAISSELVGSVRAIVTESVYAFSGKRVLIPAGSRLLGDYKQASTLGQKRVYIIWQRVLRPDGVSIELNSPSTDRMGRIGEAANYTDSHFFARFGEAILLSFISAGSSAVNVSANDEYNAMQAYRESIAQSLAATANDTLKDRHLTTPTLHVHQGTQLNVLVAKDISFQRVLEEMRNE